MKIAFAQMDPNGFIRINSFQCRCMEVKIKPSTRLFWFYYDLHRNGKSPEFGVWREVELTRLVMPALEPKEAINYESLVSLKAPKATINYVFQTRNVGKKSRKAEEKLALERAAAGASHPENADTRVPVPSHAHSPTPSLELTGENRSEPSDLMADTRRRLRAPGGEVIETYALKWGVQSSDSIVSRAPAAGREVGPDLCRGLMLTKDQSFMLQSTLRIPAPSSWLAFLWMKGMVQMEVRATQAEEELGRVQKALEVSEGQASALSIDKRNLKELSKLK
ncbi:hypothetical protein AgCh_016985 [Apium graveolens]